MNSRQLKILMFDLLNNCYFDKELLTTDLLATELQNMIF